MKKQNFNAILSAGLLLLSFIACAGRSFGGNTSFESLDTDNNDKIALQEFSENDLSMGRSPEFIFNRMDADGYGFVNTDEFAKRRQGQMQHPSNPYWPNQMQSIQ